MNNQLAKTISVIFHPLLLLIYAYFFSIIANPFVVFYNRDIIVFISVCLLVSTLFACLLIYSLYRLHYISSLGLDRKHDKITVSLIFTLVYFFCFQLFSRTLHLPFINLFLIVLLFSLILSTFANYFCRTSSHLYFVGCLCAYVIGSGLKLSINYEWIIGILFLCSGIVASARMQLHGYTLFQVCMSFLCGLIPILLLFFFLP